MGYDSRSCASSGLIEIKLRTELSKMYVLIESLHKQIENASVFDCEIISIVKTEQEAEDWQNQSPLYRAYKYVSETDIAR